MLIISQRCIHLIEYVALIALNALSRSIDLTCKVLSPTVVGLIMAYASLQISAIVIATWNVMSVFIEYAILSHVYKMVPQLAVKQWINSMFMLSCFVLMIS